MSEAVSVPAAKAFHWPRAILAGLVATVVITISLGLFGMNIMKSLGSMMMPAASTVTQYFVGGIVHLMIGLFYGVVYAWFFGRVTEWNPFLKAIVFGLAITAIALSAMPILASMMGGGAASPCNPCAAKAATPCNPCAPKAATPCNPCAPKAATPCNPCAPKAATPCNPCTATANPCNPCATKPANACNPCGGMAAANPCNPCGGQGGPFSGLISAINHVLYALALAFIYRTRPAA